MALDCDTADFLLNEMDVAFFLLIWQRSEVFA